MWELGLVCLLALSGARCEEEESGKTVGGGGAHAAVIEPHQAHDHHHSGSGGTTVIASAGGSGGFPSLPPIPTLPPLPPFPSLPGLPQLPGINNLPPLPGLPKPFTTITATKTVYVETTKRVTKHPVCMTVYGVKPPCLDAHHDSFSHEYEDIAHYHERRVPEIVPTPAAVLPVVQETRLLAEVTHSTGEPEEAENEAGEATDADREARYLVPHPAPPAPADAKAATATPLVPAAKLAHGFLGTHTETLTKTLWVTKVEKYMDYRVTATLVAKNCVPTGDPHIPFCPSHRPLHVGTEPVPQPAHQPVPQALPTSAQDHHWKDANESTP